MGHFTPSAADTTRVLIFRWTAAAGMVNLGDLPGDLPLSGGHAVTADAATMVGAGYATAGSRAFRRGSTGGGAEAIGDRGAPEWDYRAVLWDSLHVRRDLNAVVEGFGVDLDGWKFVTANAVSADGRTIAGTLQKGYGGERKFQAYHLHVPPECSDGLDNDADGAVDFGADPHCASGDDDLERRFGGCGLLGPELLWPALLLLRRRERARRPVESAAGDA